jgi:type IV secretory pathway VirB4 component
MFNSSANSQDLVPVKEIKDNTLILKDGGMCQILMVGGMNFSLKSEAEQNAITLAYQDFLNSLDFSMQIIVHSGKINIDRYLSGLESRKQGEISGLLQNQIGEYQEFIKSFVKDNAIMRKLFLVVVPFYPMNLPSQETVSKLFSFGKKQTAQQVNPEKEEEFKKNLEQLKQRVDQVVDGLKTIGLVTSRLEDEHLIELFYNFYNPETVEKQKTSAR